MFLQRINRVLGLAKRKAWSHREKGRLAGPLPAERCPPYDAVLREVQAFFADAASPDVLLSEELIRDRREEGERERRD